MTFQFKVQIKNITKPTVWRRVTVPAHFNFFDFHLVIQVAMGWFNEHMFQFSPKGYGSSPQIKLDFEDDLDDLFSNKEILDAEKTKLSDIFIEEKQEYTYIYDFGDDWLHNITLEKVLKEKTMYPRILAGKGQCPPEDCGGPWGYEHMKEVLLDPKNPEYKQYAKWLGLKKGEKWDAAQFNIEEINSIMLKVFS